VKPFSQRIPVLLTVLILLPQMLLAAEEMHFATRDGITVYGDLYRASTDASAPLILLFHQAGGDARGEYGPLVKRLTDAGYHALAIDQRIGGDRFGGTNRTLEGLEGQDYAYCDAYPDLEGALSHAKSLGFTGKIAAWGSSYSAALVFQLAAKNADDITAILAFSPASGGPLADCAPKLYSADLTIPVLALRPIGELDVPSVPPQLERFRSEGHSVYVADPGVHGSSMLNAQRVGSSTDETWAVVLEFLAESLDD
jgi:alpha-beta hydrolase superfamily lysophospholipase